MVGGVGGISECFLGIKVGENCREVVGVKEDDSGLRKKMSSSSI